VKIDDRDLWADDGDDGLSLPPRPAPAPRTGARRRHNGPFVQVSLETIYRLGAAKNASTLKLFLLLLHLRWKIGEEPFKLTNVALAGLGVDRKQKERALRELEDLDLVRVVRRERKSPLVAVLVPAVK
jgi:hypothetical protein